METLSYNTFGDKLRFFGRCYRDDNRKEVWFDWTLSGFEVMFDGAQLTADFSVIAELPSMQGPGVEQKPECPCIGVVVDDETEPSQRIELTEDGKYTLFSGEAGTHRVRVYKLSEGMRGQNGVAALSTDGKFCELPDAGKVLKIEFVGDSITCGFGNEATDPRAPFRTREENGWLTYAGIAARKLGAEASCICVSGIAVTNAKLPMQFSLGLPTMEELYEYTDGIYEEKRGMERTEKWDFKANPRDVVVINLALTTTRRYALHPIWSARWWSRSTSRSITARLLRPSAAAMGPDTWICCCLGPMSHYMFDLIREAVNDYTAATGDPKVVCFKFDMINQMFDGIGGLDHPSLKTHEKMSDELVWLIQEKCIKK